MSRVLITLSGKFFTTVKDHFQIFFPGAENSFSKVALGEL